MADYTERFSEAWSYLGDIDPASYAAEQNTGYVSLANYHRAVIIVHPGTLGGALDVDIEQATDTSGTDATSLDSGNKDITVAQTDTAPSVIEVRTEELDVTNNFDCINVEVTPAAASTFSVQIWGGVTRYSPVPTTNLDSVTD